MADREMLEMAAKAAGMGYGAENFAAPGEVDSGWGMFKGIGTYWNPLTDDGDALRLAVKLKMSVHIDDNLTDVVGPNDETTAVAHLSNPFAATRRAIVHAAAEMGAAMYAAEQNKRR